MPLDPEQPERFRPTTMAGMVACTEVVRSLEPAPLNFEVLLAFAMVAGVIRSSAVASWFISPNIAVTPA